MTPNDRKYTKTHEWIKVEGDTATVGISDNAQESLGDITFVDPVAVGLLRIQGEECAAIESVKAASDICCTSSNAVKLVFFITIPAMAGLMALDEHIVSLLFGYGEFNQSSVHLTSDCLFYLSFGLWAFTGARLFATLYYALSNIKVPFYSGLFSICLNLILCLLLIDHLGLKGLVLSVSLSGISGFIILLLNIPGIVNIDKFKITVSACRSLFLSAIMYVLVQQAADLLLIHKINKLMYGTGIILCIFFGILFYFIMNYLISSPELKILKKGIQ